MKEFKSYLKYKESESKWLKEIPTHWKVTRLKHGIELIESGKRDLVEHSDILSIGGEHIGTNYKLNLKNLKYISEEFYNKNKRGRVQIGDILIVKDGATIGKTAYIDVHQLKQKMLLNEHIYRIVAHKYIYYFILSLFFQSKIWSENNSSAQEGLNLSTIKNIPLLKPLKEEQEIIANFLDKKTFKIDSLVKKKEKQIELLKEKRLALITQAVTKGLNSNVKMKNSGIEWLGKIPAHWKIQRLKYLGKVNPVKSEIAHLSLDTEVSFIPMESLKEYGGLSLEYVQALGNVYKGYTYFCNGDVVIAKITPCFENGKSSIAEKLINGIAFGTTELHIIRPKILLDRKFLFYFTISITFRQPGKSEMYGASGQKRVPESFVKNCYIPLPSKEEQKEIANFLDKATSKIDSLIEKVENSIKLLKEYRQALITSAVTGKIDVRESQKIKRKANPLFKTAVLGAEIVAQMEDTPFGKTKFMKTLYLCEAHLQMPLQGKYKREAAGPLDNNLYKIESLMKKQGWFKIVKIGSMYKYSSIQNRNGYKKYFDKYWSEYQDKLNNLLSLVKKWTTEQSEIIGTVFAVWNDLLIENKNPSDEEIIYEVKNNWHHKKQRFSDNRLKKAIKWMKENNLIPQGYGLKTFTIKGKTK